MGYNHQLRDFDLRLAANTALASVIISKEHLHERHQQRKAGDLPLERWEHSNQLELCEPIRTQLRTQLNDLIDNQTDAHITKATNQLIDSLFQAFQNPIARTLPKAKRQTRHAAAIELLHWCSNNPSKNLTITELSEVLSQDESFVDCSDANTTATATFGTCAPDLDEPHSCPHASFAASPVATGTYLSQYVLSAIVFSVACLSIPHRLPFRNTRRQLMGRALSDSS